VTNSITFTRALFGFCCNGFFFFAVQFPLHYFEWVNEV